MTGTTIKKLAACLTLWQAAMLLCCSGCSDNGGGGSGIAQASTGPAAPFVITEFESEAASSPAGPTLLDDQQSVDSRPALKDLPGASSGNALPLTEQRQPRDGAGRDFPNASDDAQAIHDLTLALSLKSNELYFVQAECEELREQVKSLEDSVRKLVEQRVAELDHREKSGLSEFSAATELPLIFVISAKWCGYCLAWEANPGSLPKRFIDEHEARPADVTETEWAGLQIDKTANGGRLPFVFWRAKSGQIKWLVGRYSDKQLEWSIREADRLDSERQKGPVLPLVPQNQQQRQKMIRPAVAGVSLSNSSGAIR